MTSVAPTAIREVLRRTGVSDAQWSYQPGAYMIGFGPGVIMFSPFLQAFHSLREGMRWTDIDFKQFGFCTTNPQIICNANARVEGRERLTVPAGTYDAWRIVVDLAVRSGGGYSAVSGGAQLKLTYWFAEQPKRFVKFQNRVNSATWPEIVPDIELQSFASAGVR